MKVGVLVNNGVVGVYAYSSLLKWWVKVTGIGPDEVLDESTLSFLSTVEGKTAYEYKLRLDYIEGDSL